MIDIFTLCTVKMDALATSATLTQSFAFLLGNNFKTINTSTESPGFKLP